MAAITLYSASWCGACKKAKDWLVSQGADFVVKDIDEDPAAEEMTAKLKKAGLGAVGIPIFDLAGKIHVGFDPSRPPALPPGSFTAPKTTVAVAPVAPTPEPARPAPAVSPTVKKLQAPEPEAPVSDSQVALALVLGVAGGATVGFWAFDQVLGKGLRPEDKRQVGAFAVTMGVLGLAGTLGYERWFTIEGLSQQAEKIAR